MSLVSAPMKRLVRRAGLFLFPLTLASCATYQHKVADARNMLERGQTDQALEKLRPLALTADGDQLVYMLDYATAQQISGDYEGSNRTFLAADRLAEQVDYQSVSRLTGSMLMNEEMKQYKGDTFERIFINAQLALNFLQLGKLDDALVETRRMNEKYVKLRSEDKKTFELNPFAKYLSAVIWEADRKYDDAFIAYKEAYKLDPSIAGIKEDLIRSAKLSQRDDEYKRWKKEFPEVVENPQWYDKKSGEVVIIMQQGWGPRKVFSRFDATWPELAHVPSRTTSVRAEVGGVTGDSRLVYDVENASIKTLADDRAALVARRIAARVTKEVAADQIRQKNELLGAIAWVAMVASERADLRQWSTLPQSIQFIRLWMKPGDYQLNLQGLNGGDMPTEDRLENAPITVKSGRKSFVVWRTLR